MPLVGLADSDVGGGKVEEDGRAGKRGQRAGRIGRPVLLANLDTEDEARHVGSFEQQVRAEGKRLAAQLDVEAHAVAPVAEPALLVILAVIRKVALGHHAEDLPARDYHRAVVDPAITPQRSAHHQHGSKRTRRLANLAHVPLDRFEHRGLQMKIVDRIGGKRKLGEEQQVDTALVGQLRLLDDPFGIVGDIGGADLGSGRRHADEAMRVQIVKGMRIAIGHP